MRNHVPFGQDAVFYNLFYLIFEEKARQKKNSGPKRPLLSYHMTASLL
jgi:hypothetical protein